MPVMNPWTSAFHGTTALTGTIVRASRWEGIRLLVRLRTPREVYPGTGSHPLWLAPARILRGVRSALSVWHSGHIKVDALVPDRC